MKKIYCIKCNSCRKTQKYYKFSIKKVVISIICDEKIFKTEDFFGVLKILDLINNMD